MKPFYWFLMNAYLKSSTDFFLFTRRNVLSWMSSWSTLHDKAIQNVFLGGSIVKLHSHPWPVEFFFSFLFALCNYQRETSTSSEVAEVGSSIHGSRKIDYSSACLFHVLLSLLLTLFSLRLKHSLFCLTWQWKCSDIYHKRVRGSFHGVNAEGKEAS